MSRYLVDASAIIQLDLIGELPLLKKLLGRICVTREVVAECRSPGREVKAFCDPVEDWINVLPSPSRRQEFARLDRGEESLLASARPDDVLVLDDLEARRAAQARGLTYTGLLGILVAGVAERRLPAERAIELLDKIAATEFRISPSLYARVRSKLEKMRRPD